MKQSLVLLHGIGRTARSMARMARHFQRQKIRVLNIDYPSRQHNISQLIDIVYQQINRHALYSETQVNFIGHSMGGLVARGIINRYRPPQLGRVVFLGTPNYGSEWADRLHKLWLYRSFYGPSGQQLVSNPDAFPWLGPIDYELGIIAGLRKWPLFASFIIKRPNDGIVAIDSTRIAGMKEHIVIHANHTFMMQNQQVILLCDHFIHHGHFQVSSGQTQS